MQGNLTFLRPLCQGLGEQGEAGNQKQNATASADLLFCQLQAGEGLACSAGHDETATVRSYEASQHILYGCVLVRKWCLLLSKNRGLLGLILRPVDDTGFEVEQVNLADRRVLVRQRGFGVAVPQIGGGYDDAMGEPAFARG